MSQKELKIKEKKEIPIDMKTGKNEEPQIYKIVYWDNKDHGHTTFTKQTGIQDLINYCKKMGYQKYCAFNKDRKNVVNDNQEVRYF